LIKPIPEKDFLDMRKRPHPHKKTPPDIHLVQVLKKNKQTLVVMMPDEFIDFIVVQKKRSGLTNEDITNWLDSLIANATDVSAAAKQEWLKQKEKLKSAGAFLPVLNDSKTLAVLAADLLKGGSILSGYRVNTHAGRAYVILQGYPGLRSQLTGTRYLLNNPKVIRMGVGKMGAANAIKGGVVIAIVFSVAFHALDQMMNDRATWHDFVAGVGFDVASAVTGAALAWGVVSTVVGATAMAAVGPILLVVAVGAGITLALNAVGEHYEITEKLVHLLKDAESRYVSNIRQMKSEIRRGLNYADEDPVGFMRRLFGLPYLRQYY
jgi:hypothetical protein